MLCGVDDGKTQRDLPQSNDVKMRQQAIYLQLSSFITDHDHSIDEFINNDALDCLARNVMLW